MPEPTPTSEALAGIVEALKLINGLTPILNGLFENEAARLGLSRQERYELRKKLIGETRQIADELQSDES